MFTIFAKIHTKTQIFVKAAVIDLSHSDGVVVEGFEAGFEIVVARVDGQIFAVYEIIVRRTDDIVESFVRDGREGILLDTEKDLDPAAVFLLEPFDLGNITLGVLHTVSEIKGGIRVTRKADRGKSLVDGVANYLLGSVPAVAEGGMCVKI